jgi:hypothetical protein
MAEARHTHLQSQPQIQSFVTKQHKVLVPPTVPTQDHVIAYAMKLTLSENSGVAHVADPLNAITISDMLANDLLTKLEKSISNLPKMLPDVSEADDIAMFAQSVPIDMDQDCHCC